MKIFAVLLIAAVMLAGIGIVSAVSLDSPVILTSLVNQDPDPAIAGDTVEIRVGVENRGGAVEDKYALEIVPQYPFSLLPGDSGRLEVGSIAAYQYGTDMKIIKFTVKVDRDAVAGAYELKLRESEGGDTSATKSLSIDVRNRESAEVIHIDKTTLVPGKLTSLKFSINNVGSAPLRDLTFYWENTDKIVLPVGSDNTRYIKYVDVGQSAEIAYQVIADSNAAAGLYQLNLHLVYGSSSNTSSRSISTIAGIYVGGGTDFDIAFSESSSAQMSFTIANIGSNPASSVSVIIPQQQGWRTTGSNSVIIGNLNTGDYTVASFSLQSAQSLRLNATQPGQMPRLNASTPRGETPLKMQIAYTDTMGNRLSVDKEVSVNSQTATTTAAVAGQMAAGFRGARQESFLSKYKWYIVVLALLAIAGLGFAKYSREKKLNPDFELGDLFKRKGKRR